jgi:hypothetical protein
MRYSGREESFAGGCSSMAASENIVFSMKGIGKDEDERSSTNTIHNK